MRILSTVVCFLLFALTSHAQRTKYYRVQIFTNDKGLTQLASQGVGFDHGEYNKGIGLFLIFQSMN